MLDQARSNHSKFAGRCAALALALTGALVVAPGCSSDDTATPQNEGGACSGGGGPVAGTAPDHCMGKFQEVGACTTEPADGGGGGPDEPLPDPSVGSSNDDDDCKYRVSFTADCVQKNMDASFTVTLTSLTNNMAKVPGAKAYIEAYLNTTHPAGGNTEATEISPGVYKIDGVKFDASGQWTVRFHFFGACSDKPEDSPHAHVAFLVNVP